MQELHVCCLKASCVIFCLQKRMHTMNAAALKDAAEAVGKFTAAMSHWKCTIALFPHTTDCTSFNQSIPGHQPSLLLLSVTVIRGGGSVNNHTGHDLYMETSQLASSPTLSAICPITEWDREAGTSPLMSDPQGPAHKRVGWRSLSCGIM